MKLVFAAFLIAILLAGCTMPGSPSSDGWEPSGSGPARGGSGGQVVSIGGTTGSSSSRSGIVTIEQPEPGPEDKVVYIRNSKFVPETVTVKQGHTVFWYNKDTIPHSVRLIGVFDSPHLSNEGGPYWHTFTEDPGTYEYVDGITGAHAGTIIVMR